MIKFCYGRRKKFVAYAIPVGAQAAELSKRNKNHTLKEIADQLAKQYKIKNGSIILTEIEFTYEKETEEKK